MSSLFDLVGEYKELFDLLTDEEADEQTVKDTLEGIEYELEVKSEGYVTILNRLQMESDACKRQKDMWTAKYNARENAIKRLKQRMTEAMISLGKDEIKAGDNVFKLKTNGGALPVIFNEDVAIPESYMKVILEPDKKKIAEDLKSGKKLTFAHLGERGKHIEVR